jgi:6-methylsalicylate decarboxylase
MIGEEPARDAEREFRYLKPVECRPSQVLRRTLVTGRLLNGEFDRVAASNEDGNVVRSAPTRREVIKSLSVAAAGFAVLSKSVEATPIFQAPQTKQGRIDVHNHMLPPFYQKIRKAEAPGMSNSRSAAMRDWTPALAVEAMDKNGIAIAMTSLAVGGVSFNGPGGRGVAREGNEYGARMVSDYPGRFGLFAALPLPDQDGSLEELAYAFDTLKADGIAILTDYGDKWPGDPLYVPIFEELNRRKAIVFVHPTVPTCCTSLVPGVAPSTTEYLFDTTRAITSFLVNGTFTRFPDVRFIFCHSGGTAPVLANRIATLLSKEILEKMPNGVLGEFQKLYFDVANATTPSPLAALTNLVPSSQILFGSDFPFVAFESTIGPMEQAAISPGQKQAINRENAERLFPALKKS